MTDEAQTASAKPPLRDVLRAVWRMIRIGFSINPRAYPVSILLLLVASVLPFLSSYVDSRVIDEVVRLLGLDAAGRELSGLVPLIVLVVVANLVERSLWVSITFVDKLKYFSINRRMTLDFIHKASQLDMHHYESSEGSNTIHKARDMYTWRPAEFLSRCYWMTGDVIRIVSSMVIILTFSFPAFLLVVATTLPSLITNVKLGEGSWNIWDLNATDRRRFWRSAEMLTHEHSLMELRIFGSRRYLLDTINAIYDRFTNKERKDQLRRTVIESLVGNLSTVGTMIFWIVAVFAALDGQITVGLLAFYTGAVNQFSQAMHSMFRTLTNLYEDGLYLINLFRFLDLKNMVEPGTQLLDMGGKAPLIVFKDVDFAYPGTDKLVLKQFNMVIQPGEHIALVGANGAGKTTIIKLLCRFYDVTAGQILINGVDLRELDTESWYRQVGILFQDFVRYGQFAVRTNVELGDTTRIGDADLLESAIFKADAKSFIEQYQHQLEQILDKSFDGGTNPSDGQWQRIALARAFFRDAPVLVLDEPTSAIDAKAEYQIFERLYEFSQQKSLIIVSHRFSTVRNADTIYVIDNGEIAECGSHEALIRLGGRYKEAFEAQAKGYQ